MVKAVPDKRRGKGRRGRREEDDEKGGVWGVGGRGHL
jgi:hypothetical protein